MYRKIEDFERRWKTETENTQKMLAVLTDESLSQAISGDHRTIDRTAWHIIGTVTEMMSRTGLTFKNKIAEEAVPTSAQELKEMHLKVALELLEQVKSHWTDDTLTEQDDMYGEQWPRGLTLEILVLHEAHHRGQMTVLMRQAGLTVPGVYGPALEEWGTFGMEAPKV